VLACPGPTTSDTAAHPKRTKRTGGTGPWLQGGAAVSLPGDTWLRLIGWMAIGLLIYFTYSRRPSHLRREQPS
jgi:hypothetical protein